MTIREFTESNNLTIESVKQDFDIIDREWYVRLNHKSDNELLKLEISSVRMDVTGNVIYTK